MSSFKLLQAIDMIDPGYMKLGAHPASYVQPRSIKSTFCHSFNALHAVLGVLDSRACTQSRSMIHLLVTVGSPGLLRAHPVSNDRSYHCLSQFECAACSGGSPGLLCAHPVSYGQPYHLLVTV